MDSSRLIILSNRLPVKVKKIESELILEPSAGGLSTALKSYHKNNNSIWIGWPGIETKIAEEKKQVTEMLAAEHYKPIFLAKELIVNYYDGFSNSALWPLFHYFAKYVIFKEIFWDAYREVNELFAESVMQNVNEGDTVWVHDYQLLLVPQLIKSQRPDIKIGFFLHIPFPSYEIFRILPWREEILSGMLGADLIGFHTYDYARHFISSVKRLLGHDIEFSKISMESRQVYVDVFPMGIDYEKFKNKALEVQQKPIRERSKEHREIDRFLLDATGRKLILSIDRLDYTKGIPERIKAFKQFLIDYPEFKEKVSLIMLTVPSRVDVEQYQKLKNEIETLVGAVNGEFGTLSWNPIIYFYRSLPFDNLIELFSFADVALLTPLRDGMNLVAKEFIASKINQKGMLILSEMAGSTKELGEAILVNPHNIKGVADAISRALTMSAEAQKSAMSSMQERIERYNVYKWAAEFISTLKKVYEKEALHQAARKISGKLIDKIYVEFKKSKKKIFFLDYDGTLQRFFNTPAEAKPDAELMHLLAQINENVELVLISGRDKDTLNDWFGDCGFSLIAENGVWSKEKAGDWKEHHKSQSNWKESLRPVLESYIDRTPGSLIEEKSHSLVWHYRKSEIELGVLRALELTTDLSNLIINQDLEVIEGSKVVEVKLAGINKGDAAIDYMQDTVYDFILAIGDDWVDESLFRELPADSVTIKVGTNRSEAKYYVDSYREVRNLLSHLIN